MFFSLELVFLAEFGYLYILPAEGGEGVAEMELGLFLAVDQEELLEFLFLLAADVVNHLAVVAMA